ncbi:NinE family protein [Erwiniaceae bacterium BAC15a-03b]|uniref:NinE family protein n=1 Tax=Winslowiella arboricola TaxID=2978220 RepID=A0A9J6PUV7_9GAMM|nr:NinE family protein [Winslowiella arboricola]MCU5775100.1 NinE family protein [Winslowiella arboricola]MCU5780446.1 NinE family protein [Winslowiella arboricola]
MSSRKSPTQLAIDSLIYQPTRRTRSKRKPIPSASQVVTFDYTYGLLKAKWDRMRRAR